MPNHILTEIVCRGDDAILEHLVQTIRGKNEAVDFEKIVPSPPCLFRDDLDDENHAKHPNRNWHDWRLEHWGTKWNCYRSEIEHADSAVLIRFETAWSPPEPIICELSFLFPEVELFVHFYDPAQQPIGIEKYQAGRQVPDRDLPDHMVLFER